MKKALACLVCAVLAALSLPLFAAAAGEAVINVSSVSAHAGEAVDVTVDFSGNPGINTCTFSVEYDEAALTLDSVSASEAIGGTFVYVSRGVWFAESDTAYNGTFFTLHFTVKDSVAPGSYPVSISYAEGDISNANEADVNFDISAGGVTVVSAGKYTLTMDGVAGEYFAGETVSLNAEFYTDGQNGYRFAYWSGDTDVLADTSASEISFTMPEKDITLTKNYIMVGDANGDGRVNGTDTNYMKRALTGDLTGTSAMDINLDERWNGTDANLLKRILVGSYVPEK